MSEHSYPDIFTFQNGNRLTDPKDWAARADELRGLYQSEMYGYWREGEQISYSIADEGAVMISFFGTMPAEGAKNLTITVSKDGRSASWLTNSNGSPPKIVRPE